jgi:hypothetical protein
MYRERKGIAPMTTQVQMNASAMRTKILQRVMNLRARAEDAGSSEAEMNTALTMAMKLMESYNIEEAELAIAEASGEIKLEVITRVADTKILKGTKQMHKVLLTLTGISKFTETKVVYNSYSGEVTFTGHRPDIELAEFLVGVVKDALDREFDNYKRRESGRLGYGAKTSFQNAMAYRVSNRLNEMAAERDSDRRTKKAEAERLRIENASTASSTALIVSEIADQKAKEVAAEFNKAHPRLRTVKTMTRSSNTNAFSAGRAAGDRVNLGRAISRTSQKALA